MTAISEDQIAVDPHLQKDDINRHEGDGEDDEASSPFEGEKNQEPHESIFEHSSGYIAIDEGICNEIVAESENESQHNSPESNTLALVTKSIGTTLSNEIFLALR